MTGKNELFLRQEMIFALNKLGGYAVQTEQLAENGWRVNVEEIGTLLGFSKAECQQYAEYLEYLGWAKINYYAGTPCLTLTPSGYRKIRKLKIPKWRRWMKNEMLIGAIIAGLAGLIFKLMVSLLGW